MAPPIGDPPKRGNLETICSETAEDCLSENRPAKQKRTDKNAGATPNPPSAFVDARDERIAALEKALKKLEKERDEALKKKKEIDRERDEALKKKKEIDKERDEALKALKKLKLGYCIANDQLKYIYDVTSSSAHTRPDYSPAKIREKPLTCVDLDWGEIGSHIYRNDHMDGGAIDSEGAVLIKVYELLQSVLHSLGLNRFLTLHLNVTVMGVEGDIVVCLSRNKMPIGSFEAKKPKAKLSAGVNGKMNGQVHDQMYTYHLGGPSQVFSVLTTFNDWQLHSTHPFDKYETDLNAVLQKYGARKGLDEPDEKTLAKGRVSERGSQEPNSIPPSECNTKMEAANSGMPIKQKASKPKREHYVSQCVSLVPEDERKKSQNHSKEVADFIATAFVLMLNSSEDTLTKPRLSGDPLCGPICFLKVGSRLRSRPGDEFSFSHGSLKNGIDFDRAVAPTQRSFFVWYPLGKGEHGTCCLATSAIEENTNEPAACCVIKFYHSDTEPNVRKEESAWKEIYAEDKNFSGIVNAYKVPGRSRWLLIMPYIHPISLEDRKVLLEEDKETGRLARAFRHMASKGWFHNDNEVCWHHVGFSRTDKKEIKLCDFGHLEKLQDNEDHGARVAQALRSLQAKL